VAQFSSCILVTLCQLHFAFRFLTKNSRNMNLGVLEYLESTWIMQVRVDKCIMIENWRLAFPMRVLQIGVLAVTYHMWVTSSSQMTKYKAIPAFARTVLDDSPLQVERALHSDLHSHLCHPEYLRQKHYRKDHVQTFSPQGCMTPMQGDWYEKTDELLFIPTYVAETQNQQTSGTEACAALQKKCQGMRRTFHAALGRAQNREEMCRCDTDAEFFLGGVGGLKLELDAHFSDPKDDTQFGSTRNKGRNWIISICKNRFAEKQMAGFECNDPTNFTNGDPVALSIEEWLEHAILERDDIPLATLDKDIELGKENSSFLDVTNKRAKEDIAKNQPSFRMTGLELEIVVEFIKPEHSHEKSESNVRINVFAKDTFVWYGKPEVSSLVSHDLWSGEAMSISRRYQGLQIRVKPTAWTTDDNPVFVFSFFSSFFVMWTLPEVAIGAIALYFMSNTSNFYYYVANERIRLKYQLAGLVSRSVGWHYLFTFMVGSESSHRLAKLQADLKTANDVKSKTADGFDEDDADRRADSARDQLNSQLMLTPEDMCTHMCSAIGHTLYSKDKALDALGLPKGLPKGMRPNEIEGKSEADELDIDNPFARVAIREISGTGCGTKMWNYGQNKVAADRKMRECTVADLQRAAVLDTPFKLHEYEEIFNDERNWSKLERLLLPPEERAMKANTNDSEYQEEEDLRSDPTCEDLTIQTLKRSKVLKSTLTRAKDAVNISALKHKGIDLETQAI